MTPLGHFSVSYLIGKTSRKIHFPAILVGGILPDIDFVFIFFPWFNHVHRVMTHNLLFLCIAALLGTSFGSRQKRMVFLSLLLGGVLHLFVDSCLDSNPSNGIGVALFWPFYEGFFSPFNFLQIAENQVGWEDPIALIRSSIWGIVWEVPVWGIAVITFLKCRSHRILSKKVAKISRL